MKYLSALAFTLFAATSTADDFKTKVLADGLNHPWAIAPISTDDILISEKHGGIKRYLDGKLIDVTGAPKSLNKGQGGLHDLVLHPDFKNNAQVFLSFAHGTRKDNGLRVISAVLADNRLTEQTVVFDQVSRRDTPVHYGGRLAFIDDNRLLITTGDGYDYREDAQKPQSQLGKTLLIDLTTGESEVYSLGHRNPQGLVVLPDNRILLHEHGPKGGDEINLITKGANYGWPLATYGVDYSGAQISPYTKFEGTIQPLIQYTPSIAPSGLAYYQGDQFQAFSGKLLLGALKFKEVYIADISTETPTTRALKPKINERVRDIRVIDGRIFIVTDSNDGKLIELVAN